MNKRYKILLITLVLIVINIIVIKFVNLPKDDNIQISYDVLGNCSGTYQALYSTSDVFDGQQRVDALYETIGEKQNLNFEIQKEYQWIRLDFGNSIDTIVIDNIKLDYMDESIELIDYLIKEGNISNNIGNIAILEHGVQIELTGEDPYIVMDLTNIRFTSNEEGKNIAFKVSVSIILMIIVLTIQRYLKDFILIFKEVNNNKMLIWKLSRNDFKTKYAGSYLGVIWAFVQPIVTVVIYWFVFQVGFKSAPMNDFPYVLWLIAGMVPWFFYNEALLNATSSLLEYNYLVKKVVFKISILPIVKIMSSLYVHIFFIVFANIVYLIVGYLPSIYMIQVIYYSFCTFFLVLGISYATSAIIIFFKDLGQIVNILLQFGMWLTPIMWSYEMLPSEYQWILKLNPMYYIVEGYRDAFIRHVWFWERYNQTIYFWCVALVLFGVGTLIFKKLKVHFADVL
ncbi:MAG: ABC transporter permease [Cellulosilyticum sp.]|nr:ABC transporter permease [Cellulosilyticum sp.]